MDPEFGGHGDAPGFDVDFDLPRPQDFRDPIEPERALLPGRDFIEFYGRAWLPLQSYARRLVRDAFEAEEVVQDAFLKLFIAMPELESEGHAMAYLRRTVQNLCIDLYRRSSRRPVVAPLSDEHHEIESDDSAIDPVVAAEDATVIREALAKLKWEHREALIAWEIEGASTDEIASRIGVEPKNVKHTLSRARAALRRLLVGTAVDPGLDLTLPQQLTIAAQRAIPPATKAGALLVALILGWQSLTPPSSLPPMNQAETAASDVTEAQPLPTRPSRSKREMAEKGTEPRPPAASAATYVRPQATIHPHHPAPQPSREPEKPAPSSAETDAVLIQTAALRAVRPPQVTGVAATGDPRSLFSKEVRWNYSVMTSKGVIVLRSRVTLSDAGLQWYVLPLFESGGYLKSAGEMLLPAVASVDAHGSVSLAATAKIDAASIRDLVRSQATSSALSQAQPTSFNVNVSLSSDLTHIKQQELRVFY